MSSRAKKKQILRQTIVSKKQKVSSLLDVMKDGYEYSSLIDYLPDGMNIGEELCKAISDIEQIRKKPIICYVSNVLRAGDVFTSIEISDDVPFSEMVDSVPNNIDDIDIFIATPGGRADQVSSFVNKIRKKFSKVSFIIPHMAMSAGTILAFSGNEILMDERGFIGPIDPQVPTKDGRYLPAQALLTLIKQIQKDGEENLKQSIHPSWADVRILDNIDAKEIGNAISATEYSVLLASEYLEKYKFKDWLHHKNGDIVTNEERHDRALKVAKDFCSHEIWKIHSHGIFREVAWEKLQLKITHLEEIEGLKRAVRRLWALFYWSFENTRINKTYISKNYSLFRAKPQEDK